MVKPGDTLDELPRDNPVWLAWRTGDFEWWSKSDRANFDFEWHHCRHTADRGEGGLCARVMLVVTARHEEEHFDSGLTFKHVTAKNAAHDAVQSLTAGQGETGIVNRDPTIKGIPTSDEGLEFDLRHTFRGRHLMRF